MQTYVVYCTTTDRSEARSIGRALVEERLVACVNIIDKMESLYWWENDIQQDRETVLIAKTREDALDSLIARIRALHSYDVPCVVALPIARGNPDYLSWINDMVGGSASLSG